MEVDSVFYTDRSGRVSSNPLLDQLPSYQSLLYRRKSSTAGTKRRSSSRGRIGSSGSGKWGWAPSAGIRRNRRVRRRRNPSGNFPGPWPRNAETTLGGRSRAQQLETVGAQHLPASEEAEGRWMFGTGILSYFSFLRFLVMLNLIIFVLMFSFVMLPIIIAPNVSGNITYNLNLGSECSVYPRSARRGLVIFHEHITDLLSGGGFLEQTYLFYGYYKADKIHFSNSTYNLPLAYLLVTIAYLFFSLIWIVKRSATGFKRNLVQDEDRFQSFCNKIFAGWDFCITDENATDLEEERIKQKIAERTRKERCRIYLIRLILNLFVIGVLIGCFYSIYRATIFSQKVQMDTNKDNFIVDLIYEYLPSIVITLANFITPLLFSAIINYEDYSPAFEIRFTLMRCVFMRLTSIGVLLFSLWSQITKCEKEPCLCGYNHVLYSCWETRVGQEMYKLTIFDFIIIFAVTVFVEFPRKLIVQHCDCGLAKWFGQQEFAIPQNVLEIVYGQTICWIGTFYSPMLPAICTMKYFFIFYIKKVSLINNCRPATRPFRASSSNFFFLVVLLIGLALACLPVSFSNKLFPCGPFVNYTTSWEVLPNTVSELPHGIKTLLFALSSEAFAVSFFVVTCLIMFYVIALAGAHKRVINQLREQLVVEGRDKRFLIQKLCQAQRLSAIKSPGSKSQPRSPSYHTSFSNNFNESVFLAHSPPDSSTHRPLLGALRSASDSSSAGTEPEAACCCLVGSSRDQLAENVENYDPGRLSSDDIVVACGGFVKSDVEINYSLIEIKLYTKQGSLKYQTDCAPINGYFMIPLYDKGDFVLKIEPPLGWSFEPTSVDLHVDGVSDICTKEEDINFVFTGFSVSGTVLSKGHPLGPAGVEVKLTRVGTEEKLQSVVTKPGGKYTFLKVLPGNYDITASHPSWTLEQSATSVVVSNANAPAAENLVVGGYDVSGEVRSDGEPMKEVTFLLYSATVKKEDVGGCNTSPVEGADPGDSSLLYLCSALSREDGTFVFLSLASGEYTVVPFYRGERITFDVAPSRMNFKPIFRVMGFSVTGRVLNSDGGRVSLMPQFISNEEGSFRLENMTAGTYTIRVTKELMFFEPITVKIAPNTPQLPDIITAGFSVCGQISVSRLPEGMKQQGRYKVTLTQQGQDKASSKTVDSDPQGPSAFRPNPETTVSIDIIDFSAYVAVSLPEAEVRAGLALQPQALEVSLVDRPLTDLLFTQFMASVSGKVYCLASCDDLSVTLQPVSRQGERRTVALSGSNDILSFSFEDVLPGKYKVSITHEEWCWKHKSMEVEVLDSDVVGVEFRQIGYILRCSLSHAITLYLMCVSDGDTSTIILIISVFLDRSSSKMAANPKTLACVYKVTPRSCHQFEQDFYTYDTSAPSILTLTAVRHHMTGLITTDKILDVTVTIKSSIESEPALVLGPLRSLEEQRLEQQLQEITLRRQERERRAAEEEGGARDDSPPIQEKAGDLTGPFHYEFSYWARAGEKITVTPSSKELLFYPPEVEATITGVVVSGSGGHRRASRALPGGQSVSRAAGIYPRPAVLFSAVLPSLLSVGPLHSDRQYDISASKEGFVLSPVEGTVGDFKAFALAGVTFKIRSEDGIPLSGVLLSLSGGQFRSNLLTQDTGLLTFNNLSPGQYYFKPMMKEFRFEPASQMIAVEEGQNLSIDITGIKTAYRGLTCPQHKSDECLYVLSCYGAVQSLSGDAEGRCRGGDCSIYSEDTVTDEEGRFRLRGLLPGCKYLIQLRAEGNDHIERALPQYRAVEVGSNDIEGVNIIAFRQINQFDLSGNVKLYKSDNMDNPINSISLGQSLFFNFPPLDRDGESYVLILHSTLSRFQFDFTLPQVTFTSNGYHKHITLTFNPTRKVPDQDVAQGSYIALPLTLLLLLAAYNHEKVIPLLLQLVNRIQGVRSMSQVSADNAALDEAKRQAKRQKARRT
ncbi:hypothetical protein F7725_016022 [Dissostichus mawsoni]|uniref:Transmembrane channel-like protein n=1 Tax=Dissostichus mawsoni TaxID=36200 RepID=A0A7J5Y3E9_DISMA|nr:hypothetical protein F7725_016022 [Dissostichus mawsoni]